MLERLKPIVKVAIQNSISDMTRQGIEDQQIEAQTSQLKKNSEIKLDKSIKSPIDTQVAVKDPESGIETTDEELTALNLIKTILEKNSKDIKDVYGTDTVNYYSVSNLSMKKWFIRFVLRPEKKSLSVRLPPEKVNTLLKDFTIEDAPSHLGGGTKIIINSIKDLLKMQDLIVYCFDEVNKL